MDDDTLYKALADPTRRIILDELAQRDAQSLFELCARLVTRHGIGSSRQAISQHLAILEAAGLVVTQRDGRLKLHSFDRTPLAAIAARWPQTKRTGRPRTTKSSARKHPTKRSKTNPAPKRAHKRRDR
jgi:DNA-binding transcriptional ArsR family regulator